MDPRHPELAVARIKELIKQYDDVEERMKHATTSAQLSQAEREGGLVIQEICLVAPRIHEAMMQTSRNRRHDLTHGDIYNDIREYIATAEPDGEGEPDIRMDNKTAKEIIKAVEEKEKESKKKASKKKSTKKKKADK